MKSQGTTKKKSAGRISKLELLLKHNPKQYKKMLEMLRNGSYICSAALAIGVTAETFSRWIAKGKEAKRGIYRQFYEEVMVAVAQATVEAEIEIRKKDPKFWLQRGPGRLFGFHWGKDEERAVNISIHTDRKAPLHVDNVTDEGYEEKLKEGIRALNAPNS